MNCYQEHLPDFLKEKINSEEALLTEIIVGDIRNSKADKDGKTRKNLPFSADKSRKIRSGGSYPDRRLLAIFYVLSDMMQKGFNIGDLLIETSKGPMLKEYWKDTQEIVDGINEFLKKYSADGIKQLYFHSFFDVAFFRCLKYQMCFVNYDLYLSGLKNAAKNQARTKGLDYKVGTSTFLYNDGNTTFYNRITERDFEEYIYEKIAARAGVYRRISEVLFKGIDDTEYDALWTIFLPNNSGVDARLLGDLDRRTIIAIAGKLEVAEEEVDALFSHIGYSAMTSIERQYFYCNRVNDIDTWTEKWMDYDAEILMRSKTKDQWKYRHFGLAAAQIDSFKILFAHLLGNMVLDGYELEYPESIFNERFVNAAKLRRGLMSNIELWLEKYNERTDANEYNVNDNLSEAAIVLQRQFFNSDYMQTGYYTVERLSDSVDVEDAVFDDNNILLCFNYIALLYTVFTGNIYYGVYDPEIDGKTIESYLFPQNEDLRIKLMDCFKLFLGEDYSFLEMDSDELYENVFGDKGIFGTIHKSIPKT